MMMHHDHDDTTTTDDHRLVAAALSGPAIGDAAPSGPAIGAEKIKDVHHYCCVCFISTIVLFSV
jgi:hypothetical protein